jgi:transcription antitermination factor NusG
MVTLAEPQLEHWHVIRSKPNKEDSLARYLTLQGHPLFYPQFPANPVNPRARKVKPYFPGYMFLRADLAQVGESAFQYVPFSAGLVRLGGEPAVVHETVIGRLQDRMAEIWEIGTLPGPDFVPGERVMMVEGAFEGYEGIFDASLSGTNRVRILLKMLSDRFMPVEVDRALVAKM